MARRKPKRAPKAKQTPKVRQGHPKNRPIQLRYFCPVENREIRLSTGTYDEVEADQQQAELEAQLLLGIAPSKQKKKSTGPQMLWEDFREDYRELQLSTLRDKSARDAECRLDIAERIIKPRTLADVASPDVLHRLQARLLAGAESVKTKANPKGKARSPHTVKGYMASIMASLNWAHLQGYLPEVPRIAKLKVAKLKSMKGRPVCLEEFERMLSVVPKVVGDVAAPSWRYLLRGAWESGLRLDELMHLSWDVPGSIQPDWPRGGWPVLNIPAAMQKNDTEESIPMTPGLERLLLETPTDQRTGWVFDPAPSKWASGRLTTGWASRVVSAIGQKANVIVTPEDPKTGKETKFASAHDLRRGLAERLRNAGVPPLITRRIMRHASFATTERHYAPGNVQSEAKSLRMYLGTLSESGPDDLNTPEDETRYVAMGSITHPR